MTHQVLQYAADTDTGLRREINEDSVYASARLLAVADGIGGQPHGEVASAAAVSVLAELDSHLQADLTGVDLQATLAGGISRIGEVLAEMAEQNPATHGMGTTLTALLFDGSRFTAAHVGDSRGYVLREGALHRFTHDHTLVQALVEEGRITPEEAINHPRRSMIMKALQSTGASEPDLQTFDAYPGDRYLLCSDGLTAGATEEAVRTVLTEVTEPADAVRELIALANAGGGPDNITCVVADVTQS